MPSNFGFTKDNNSFSNNFSNSFGTKFGDNTNFPSRTREVDIIDQMDAYVPLLSPSEQKEYNDTKDKEGKPSFFQKVISILSSGETGQAAYDLLEGKNPVASYGKSVVEGLSGQGYDKKTYADVLEKLGMSKGSLSTLMPWLYNETGKGWKFKKDGFLDPTAQGTLGLALDILADPTTYLGGAGVFKRGIKSMKGLSKEGKAAAISIADEFAPLLKEAEKAGDLAKMAKLGEEASVKTARLMKSDPDKYFSGIKFMGKEIVPRATTLAPGRYADKLMGHIPILNKAYEGAKYGVQDVFKYGADILKGASDDAKLNTAVELAQKGIDPKSKEGLSIAEKFNNMGSMSAEAYLDLQKSTQRNAQYVYNNLYNDIFNGNKSFKNIVGKEDLNAARQYLSDKIMTNMSSAGLTEPTKEALDSMISVIGKYQDDIANGIAGSREGLNKEMFSILDSHLSKILTPEARAAKKAAEQAGYKGGVASYWSSGSDKSIKRWLLRSKDGKEIVGNVEKLGLQPYKKAAEANFYTKHFNKLIKTQEKNIDKILSQIKGVERKKLSALKGLDDSTKFTKKQVTDKLNYLDQAVRKLEGKTNPISLQIAELIKTLNNKLAELPDAERYFKDKKGKVFEIIRPESITEGNSAKEIQEFMEKFGQKGKNFFETDPFAISLVQGKKATMEMQKNELLKGILNDPLLSMKSNDFVTNVKRSADRRTVTKELVYNDVYKDGIRWIDPKIPTLPEGTLVPSYVAGALNKTMKAFDNESTIAKSLQMYDKLLSSWKGAVYGWFPASHGRNLIGGSFMNFVENAKWAKYTKYTKGIIKGTDDVIDLGEKSIYKNITKADIKKEFAKRGGLGQSGASDIMDISKTLNPNLWDKVNQLPMKPGEMVENNLRIPLFLAELSDGKTFDEAMSTVYKVHFDYAPQAATEIERNVLKRLIPFYTWQRNAIPMMIEKTIETPGKMTGFYKMMRDASDDQGNLDRSLLPSYLEGDPAIMKGGTVTSGLGLPPNQLLQFFDGGDKSIMKGVIDSVVGSISPVVKIPIELLTNFNTFKDKQISEDKSGEFARNMPDVIKNWLEWKDTSFDKDGKEINNSKVNPIRKYWLYALPTGRLATTFAQQTGETEEGKIMKFLAGVSTITPDIENLKAIKQKEYEKKLLDIMQEAGIYSQYGTAYKGSKEKLQELK